MLLFDVLCYEIGLIGIYVGCEYGVCGVCIV